MCCAAIRIPASDDPPNHSGTCGFCTTGSPKFDPAPRTEKCRPSKSTTSPETNRRKISQYSPASS